MGICKGPTEGRKFRFLGVLADLSQYITAENTGYLAFTLPGPPPDQPLKAGVGNNQ